MALTTRLKVDINAFLTGLGDLGSPQANLSLSYARDWVNGTAASQADLAWGDTNTLAASATTDIDLAGSLTNPLGGTLTFARVKALLVVASAANTNNVVVGGAASAQWVGPFGAATHTVALQPGAGFFIATPTAAAWPVTATTADLLRIANSAGSTGVDYSILLVGASA